MERPYSRQRFTQLLTLVCQSLDERHRGMVDYHLDYAPTAVHGKVSSTIRSVQVFGSWARGALICGNLDLAVELDHHWVDGPWWGNRQLADHPIDGVQVARALMGRHPGVRYLPLQAALDGPQAIDPDELRPIWRAPAAGQQALDWRKAILAVPLDPHAHRFSRSIVSLSASPDSAGTGSRRKPAADRARCATAPERTRPSSRHPGRDTPAAPA